MSQFPKKGDLSSPGNYRPISILSLLSKLLERHIYRIVLNHLYVHYPISGSGASPVVSQPCTTAFLSFSHNCLQSLDNKTDMLSLLWYQQGFRFSPTCSFTPKTIHNLIHLDPHIIKWIQSYLSCREQYVVVNGTQSLTLPVLCGVPQGPRSPPIPHLH